MTPFEIAITLRNRPDGGESDEAFVKRALGGERLCDFGAAVELMGAWEQAGDDFVALLDCLKPVERRNRAATIADLIERKRQLGYDAKLEALLARRWRCPHCKQFSSVDKVTISQGDRGLFRCTTCGEEGVHPVEAKAVLRVEDGGKSGLRPTGS